ncbi:MAG: ATP-NAD kinase family protein [Candidatus Methanomethylicia archaeon]|nr:ATP-NAD kinase family protein [Candidatus Methanomethylicia archaeon]
MGEIRLKKIGLIVNPIAGMGGRVGLKGTDGFEILKKAIELGAKPVSPEKTVKFLKYLKNFNLNFELIAYPKIMGEYEAYEAGFNPIVVGSINDVTTSEDTVKAAILMRDLKVDLIVFCGGDGTARDICRALNLSVPVIGVPAGVKMYSAVFTSNIHYAAKLVAEFIKHNLPLREAEVMDVDEDAFRSNRLSVRLYGYLMVPYIPEYVQRAKSPTISINSELENQRAIAKYVVESMDPEALYILGPGTTIKAIADLMGLEKTLLGVDLVAGFKLLAKDVSETDIIRFLNSGLFEKVYIVVSPIGGQGFIFGRGNQQISDEIIKRVGVNNVIVVATWSKLSNIDCLRVDTGDPDLDDKFRGYIRVIVDYGEEKVVKVI